MVGGFAVREVSVGLWERIHKDELIGSADSADEGSVRQIIDTGPTVADAVETANEHRREVWGRPGFCPKCGGRGYLDRIDVVDRIMYEHCTECFSKWSVAESDTESPAR